MGDVQPVRCVLDQDELLPSMASAVRRPLTSKGTIASESPWMTKVGMVNAFRSPRKSVLAHAVVQSRVPLGDAAAAIACSAATVH